ncbi:flagellar motor protein MotD [Thiomonas bhubaneswarensis]|uniref:Flagellar motor protein MotB n=1 Tax=Thiomonas bhubaneswarensis TaxID=339866 RepID=A0A0K6I0X9_9BURK|nr:flagellar motor protein MotD [Thiomonas bhubaneswarensis]CUA96731.1 Flagellar motor protein MotB [Thiomonas bhubaneswarensis]
MARKKAHEEHENHERWLVSYADFITLLFAFFVVMYSISSLNEGKYKVLSQTMIAAFTGQPTTPNPVQVGQPFNSMPSAIDLPPIPKQQKPEIIQPGRGGPGAKEVQKTLEGVARQIEALLSSAIRKGDVQVRMTPLGVVIDIHDTVLFASGQAELTPQAQELLDQIAQVLHGVDYPIQVNGYTDDRPINTPLYRSNWALSSARAVSVVEMFIAQGVRPEQLVAAGYGQYHPVASNDTAKGRAANRRVSVVIVSPLSHANVNETPILPAQAPAQPAGPAAELTPVTPPSPGTHS